MATILCVDNDPDILDLYGSLLKSKGYKFLSASDGPSGIALAQTHELDAVVLDIKMPGMDGNQVAQILRTERPTLPIVIFTGSLDETPESLKWFANVLLHKGNGPLALLLTIEKLLKDFAVKKKPSRRADQNGIASSPGRAHGI